MPTMFIDMRTHIFICSIIISAFKRTLGGLVLAEYKIGRGFGLVWQH
jgi:hypothetical protein